MRSQYTTIDELLDAESFTRCDGCKYFNSWQERHPYGIGWAGENMAECTAPSDKACPALNPDAPDDEE